MHIHAALNYVFDTCMHNIHTALNFQLSESDYSVRDNVLSIEVTSSGRHDGVTVRIISLAISVYVQQYPDLPCGEPEDILKGSLAADSKDYMQQGPYIG